jgi:hypothetical protein
MQFGRASALAVAALLGSGCDFPTEPPILEHDWVVPVDRTTVSVAELLPVGVTLSGGAFALAVEPVVSARTLGSLCPPCAPLDGQTVPVPPFQASFGSSSRLPADVTSAVLASGTVQLSLRNGLAFNPLANGGVIVITLRDGAAGRQLGRLELRGPGDALPAGGTLTRTVALAPGAIGPVLTSTTDLTVRAGSVARIDTDQEIRLTATPAGVLASSAGVDVSGEPVTFESVEVDVADLEDFEEDIASGALLLDVTNPFGVALNGQIRVIYPDGTLTKPVTIGAAPRSSVSIPFSADELRAFIGAAPVTLSGSGTVAGGAGAITVAPQQVLDIAAKLRLTVQIGG